MLTTLLVALAAGAGPGEGPPAKRELTVLARAPWRPAGGGGAAQQRVLRTAEEAALALGIPADRAREEAGRKEATERLSRIFKVESIDWKDQMVVVVTAGVKRTGGYRVQIERLSVEGGTLTVRWKLHTPGRGRPVTMALTHPGEAVLTDRFGGKVRFDPPAPKADPKGR